MSEIKEQINAQEKQEMPVPKLSDFIKEKTIRTTNSAMMLMRNAGLTSEEIAFGQANMLHGFFSQSILGVYEEAGKEYNPEESSKVYAELSREISALIGSKGLNQAESMLVLTAICHLKLEELVTNIYDNLTEEDIQLIKDSNPLIKAISE